MAQLVSAKFANAQDSPANLPVAKVQLMLGNYCSAAAFGATVTSSGDDASGDFPASGVIDGDRTEINVGAASVADNSVGLSSWRSSGIPNNGDPTWVAVNFNAARTINRVKIYGLTNHLLKGVTISYWNGSSWVTLGVAQQTDFAFPTGLFIFDFPDVTTTQIRFDVINTINNPEQANIVEVEAYRLLDITGRVKGIKVSRQRDYKLANPMAATVQLDCINTDRFFSINHVPTAAEVAAGFVNQELKPNVQILVQFGFNLYGSSSELVPAVVAYLDSITPKPKSRDCRIAGRDVLKALINQVDSTNLKTNIDISDAILYVLNRGNISVWETSIGVTGIVIPYFFTDQEDHLTTIRTLTQAAGDSLFYIDEAGKAVFRFYTGNLPLSFTYPTEADWTTGTFTGNMVKDGSDRLALNVQHTTPVTYQNTQSHTVFVATFDNFEVNEFAQSFKLPYDTVLSNVAFTIQYSSNGARVATFNVWADAGGTPGAVVYSTTTTLAGTSNIIVSQALSFSPNLSLSQGIYWYGLNTGSNVNFSFVGGLVDRAVIGQTPPMLPAPYARTLGQNPIQGIWKILVATNDNNNPVLIWGNYTFLEASGSGTWTSPVLDTGAGTTAFSPIVPVSVVNGNTLSYATQSSADGIHFSGFVAVAPNGQPLSPTARYIQVQVSMVQNPLVGVSALVLDLEINWVGGNGSPKYVAAPSSFTFDYNSNLIDVAQELADNLGGDTSIVNDVSVQASPLILKGSDSDVVWQGTIGSPPVNISVSTPLAVTPGQGLIITPYISGGMDTSHMDAHTPPALLVTFANGAAGLTFCTFKNPTVPVFEINMTTGGLITNLQVVGKTFSSAAVNQAAQARNAKSVQQFGDRRQSLTNPWIASPSVAQVIANSIVSNFANPFSYIPSFEVQPTFSMQIGDRITVHDVNLDLNEDYITVGVDHEFTVSGDRGTVKTTGKLLAVPAGL